MFQVKGIKIHLYTVCAAWIIVSASCKKNDLDAGNDIPKEGTRLELSMDSLYLYARETYFWYKDIPSYAAFNPRGYILSNDMDIASLQNELNAIAKLSVNPQTQKPYEFKQGSVQPVYSFIQEGNVFGNRVATVNLEGAGDGFGLGMAIISGNKVYVNYVEAGSPADEAGITRGMRVDSIKGIRVPLNSNIIEEVLNGEKAVISFEKQDGSRLTADLIRKTYDASPVLKSKIIQSGNEEYGYVALARFSNPEHDRPYLDKVFDVFAEKNIFRLIIDLRYNNGGYVASAEHLANLMAPSGANGKIMYAEHFNDLLQNGKAPILKTIPYLDEKGKPVYVKGRPATYADVDFSVSGNTYLFSKKGNLNTMSAVTFIVSGITASASELVINCLRPYVNVKLVGSATYGKPVGAFGIGIDRYTLYLTQFQIMNANNEGDYFEGIPVDIDAADDVTKDFGDPLEDGLSKAVAAFKNTSGNRSSVRPLRTEMKNNVAPGDGGVMVENRLRVGE